MKCVCFFHRFFFLYYPELSAYCFLEKTSLVTDIMLLKKFAKSYSACEYLEIGSWRGENIVNVAESAAQCTSITLSPDEMRLKNISKAFIDFAWIFSERRQKYYGNTPRFIHFRF